MQAFSFSSHAKGNAELSALFHLLEHVPTINIGVYKGFRSHIISLHLELAGEVPW